MLQKCMITLRRKKYASQNSYEAHLESKRHKEAQAAFDARPKTDGSDSKASECMFINLVRMHRMKCTIDGAAKKPRAPTFGPKTPGFAEMTDVRAPLRLTMMRRMMFVQHTPMQHDCTGSQLLRSLSALGRAVRCDVM